MMIFTFLRQGNAHLFSFTISFGKFLAQARTHIYLYVISEVDVAPPTASLNVFSER